LSSIYEQDLEPDAVAGDAGQFVLAEFGALFLAERIPFSRAVERAAVLEVEVHVSGDRRVPVDVDQRVVELVCSGFEQPVRGLVTVCIAG
jgi:hypothetical protein